MIHIFDDKSGRNANAKFQRWRKENPDGFYIAWRSKSKGMLHRTSCWHVGNMDWQSKQFGGTSLTKQKKVCSTNVEELSVWARANRVSTLARCTHCSPPPTAGASVKTFILCWNPNRWAWPKFDEIVDRNNQGELIDEPWGTGNHTAITAGQRVFLYRQAADRGIIGSGWTTADVEFGERWDGSGRQGPFVAVSFDRLLLPGDVLPLATLVARLPEFNWARLEASGVSLKASVSLELENLWSDHLKTVGVSLFPDDVSVPTRFFEGATRRVSVNAYERDANARKACVNHYRYICDVCKFDFAKFYGEEIGEDFIHVHHLKDLATIRRRYEVDPIKDLRPVCPNCHAMLHRETPAMSINKLRAIVKPGDAGSLNQRQSDSVNDAAHLAALGSEIFRRLQQWANMDGVKPLRRADWPLAHRRPWPGSLRSERRCAFYRLGARSPVLSRPPSVIIGAHCLWLGGKFGWIASSPARARIM